MVDVRCVRQVSVVGNTFLETFASRVIQKLLSGQPYSDDLRRRAATWPSHISFGSAVGSRPNGHFVREAGKLQLLTVIDVTWQIINTHTHTQSQMTQMTDHCLSFLTDSNST